MKIYFTRHGETEWNKIDKIQGQMDSPLNENGINMAKKLREKARNINFSHIYSSDLNRALDTCKIICPNKKIITSPLLREIDVGYWSAKQFNDIKKTDPFLYNLYFTKPEKYNRIDGESFYELIDRVKRFFELYIYNSDDENILIVSHGITIIAMFTIMENIEIKNFWQNRVRRNAEFNIAEYKDSKFTILKKAPLNLVNNI